MDTQQNVSHRESVISTRLKRLILNDKSSRWFLSENWKPFPTVGLGVEEVKSAPRSPWQNPFAERMIGTFRRELTNHVIVLDERHLKRLLGDFIAYYHDWRCHLSLDKDAPSGREVQNSESGDVIAFSMVRGLHHRYERRAA